MLYCILFVLTFIAIIGSYVLILLNRSVYNNLFENPEVKPSWERSVTDDLVILLHKKNKNIQESFEVAVWLTVTSAFMLLIALIAATLNFLVIPVALITLGIYYYSNKRK